MACAIHTTQSRADQALARLLDEAFTNAREVIVLHLEGLLDDGLSFPKPSTIEQLRRKRGYRRWTRAIVDVDVGELGDKAARTLRCRSGFSARWMLTPINRVKRGQDSLPARRWARCVNRYERKRVFATPLPY